MSLHIHFVRRNIRVQISFYYGFEGEAKNTLTTKEVRTLLYKKCPENCTKKHP